jgi:hypothetical protein
MHIRACCMYLKWSICHNDTFYAQVRGKASTTDCVVLGLVVGAILLYVVSPFIPSLRFDYILESLVSTLTRAHSYISPDGVYILFLLAGALLTFCLRKRLWMLLGLKGDH